MAKCLFTLEQRQVNKCPHMFALIIPKTIFIVIAGQIFPETIIVNNHIRIY